MIQTKSDVLPFIEKDDIFQVPAEYLSLGFY